MNEQERKNMNAVTKRMREERLRQPVPMAPEPEQRLECPLRNFSSCAGDRCAWYVKEKNGGFTYTNGDMCALTKLAMDGGMD